VPSMNAYQATWEILSIRKGNHPIILIVTAINILQSGEEKCLVAGISDFINKPMSARLLGWEYVEGHGETVSGNSIPACNL